MSKPWDHLLEADRDLRALHRRWKSSGNLDDFAPFLASWLRSGEPADRWDLDSYSRYSKDFDALVNYCRVKLKGSVIPARGKRTPNGGQDRFNVDFYLPGEPNKFQVQRILYPTDSYLREWAAYYLQNDGGRRANILGERLLLHNILGWTRTFNVSVSSPQPFQLIRERANKAIKVVFKGRIRP